MKKSNIVLAILAGAAIGGIVAIILKAENEISNLNVDEEENSSFDKIAQQFSDKLSIRSKNSRIKNQINRKE